MNVLLLGSGGREHAIAWKISESKLLTKLFIAPGNAGTMQCGTNINIGVTDFAAIKKCVIENSIQLVIVGPEDPLVQGIADYFFNDEQLKNIPLIGPQAKGAMLEGSKDFAKAFMQRHAIPTAKYCTVTKNNFEEGISFLKTVTAPYVLKADGLAAGKGVLILDSITDAEEELRQMIFDKKFGAASASVVIEEFISGIEISCFVITDGISYKILPEAKDYKRIGEGDTGLNTGGMGAVSPVPFANAALMQKVEERIIKPTIDGLKKDNINYCGFIFIGLMKKGDDPYVIEYNCRMGDPETEVVMPRIKSDVLEMFMSVAQKKLSNYTLQLDNRFATTVMLVSGGYPGDYTKGKEITGATSKPESTLFHAGTVLKEDKILTNGGRVIAVTSIDESLSGALKKSYAAIETISFDGMYFRKDIGKDLDVSA
jgi:phosphoribosylamine--glycine ligase